MENKKTIIVFATILGLILMLGPVMIAGAQPLGRGTVTIKELVRGAPIHGSNGIKIGPDGLLYIASVLGREILIMDPLNGKILETYDSAQGVAGPDDLVFGPDGSLYWTDILSGEVGRLAPDGTVTKQLVAEFVNPIAFNAEGRLFVAQAFLGDGLYELDPNLVDPPELILGVGNPALHLNGMEFGPDGLLYAPRQQLNQIVRIDVDADPVVVEVLTDQFEGACAFDSNGDLYVATGDRIVHFDVDTDEVTTVTEIEYDLDNLAFDSNDNLYASNFRNGAIYKILKNGEFRFLSRGGLIAPAGIAVLPDDHTGESIFVADFWRVMEFDGLNGQPGISGIDFFFDSPFSASADGDNLILTSWFGNTVEIWDPSTTSVLSTELFDIPMNAVRFMGEIVVAELGTGSVVSLDQTTSIRTTLASGLFVPTGLAATDDDLWVADWASGVVWQVVQDGAVLSSPIPTAVGLTTPEGMALDHDGSLLVVESALGRVSRVDPDTGEFTVVAADLALGEPGSPGWPPTWFFNGVAVGEHSDIYVTGGIDNVVYRIRERP
jgi:sugar lactone lactonase YvrE